MPATLSLLEAHALVTGILAANGCGDRQARVVAEAVVAAERDGATATVSSDCRATLPTSQSAGSTAGRSRSSRMPPRTRGVDAANGYAQVALADGRDCLMAKVRAQGIAALAIRNSHHFAALWTDVEPLADAGLVAFAFGNGRSRVVPFGGGRRLFGTNPMAFACPRRTARQWSGTKPRA